mmetsp:Transcript_37625/g.72108  ORF Transcript_37625/g.72108 Transcript_37625/m.72108 type:complete len:226 (+) Transcript_37625:662-1339(+)
MWQGLSSSGINRGRGGHGGSCAHHAHDQELGRGAQDPAGEPQALYIPGVASASFCLLSLASGLFLHHHWVRRGGVPSAQVPKGAAGGAADCRVDVPDDCQDARRVLCAGARRLPGGAGAAASAAGEEHVQSQPLCGVRLSPPALHVRAAGELVSRLEQHRDPHHPAGPAMPDGGVGAALLPALHQRGARAVRERLRRRDVHHDGPGQLHQLLRRQLGAGYRGGVL